MNNRISKRLLIGISLVMLSSTVVFANGSVEEMDNGNMRGNQSKGSRGMMGDWGEMQATTVEGTFSMVEDRYPSVITADGDMSYLLIHFPISENLVPAEGAFLKLETLQSPLAPDQLIVLSGEADGVVFDGMNGRGMMGRPGNRGTSVPEND